MSDIKALFEGKVKGELVFAPFIDKKYLSDFIGYYQGKADVYVKPVDDEDVQTVMKIAYANKLNVTIRGAGTNLAGSTIPDGGVVLDMSGMNKILKLDEDTLTITVEPGVILKDLIKYVEDRGYLYAPDPAEKGASIGGNVSTNAGGMRAVKYGVTRNYVLGLDLVKVDGTKISLGSKTYKYSSGLNLQQLVVGSEGTLGVITKITLKLLPLPEFTLNTVIAFDSLSQGIKNVNKIFKSHLDPTAIEFVEKKVIAYGEKFLNKEFPCQRAKSYLIVALDGDKDGVYERFEKLKQVVTDNGAIDVIPLDDPAVAKEVWEIRGAIARAVNASGPWEPIDTVVPLDKITTFVDYVNSLIEQGYPRMVAFGHAGDGNVHLCVLKDDIPDDKWRDILNDTMEKLYGKAYELGGLVSGEHGVGKGKRKYFIENTDPLERELMINVKKSFDEFNLLNPHNGYAK
ncbi:MAG: FAD-binding oxidoreductase [Succinatimonas sp.]|jgi:glycolate oxidase|nr:FAD-binding oxidoreductase [Succinatimonas sp.]MDD5869733.1 FAD-binding oxidoreductase [Succinatimonas sp.]